MSYYKDCPLSADLVYHNAIITRQAREKLNNHKSVVIWFTGLSGSGKSTIANSVEEKLYSLNCRTFVLDGDNIRHGLSSDLSFSASDRKENVRRVGEVAKLMMESGVIVLAAFVSPFEEDRDFVRKLLPQGDFLEVYCNASLEVCESRDVKGLYRRARNGKIKSYTGIDSPYEAPINPDLVIDTGNTSLQESVARVVNLIKSMGIIK